MLSFLSKFIGNGGSAPAAKLDDVTDRLRREIAERERAERAVGESEERLNLALRSAGIGTWSWDIPADQVIWDDYLHPLFGLEPGMFGGRYEDFTELVHADDRERVGREVQAAIEQNEEYDTEFQVVWPDGSTHYVQTRGKVYRDAAGAAVRMTGVCWDDTARAKVEKELEDSKALYASLVDNLPVHVLRKDLDGRITFVNRMFCELLQMPPEEILGKTDFDFFPDELAEKYRADDRRIVETGKLFEDVEENRTDGEVRYFHVLKSGVRNAAGAIVGTQAVFWDVTDRRRAENDLEKERYLLRCLMDNVPDSIYFKDRESRFLQVSAALAQRFGLDNPTEAQGKSDGDFFTEEHARQALEDEKKLVESGEPIVGKEEVETWPDGRKTWVSTTKLPLRDRAGNVIGSFGISRDITDQKLATQALQENEERTRMIVDTALDAFVAMNPDGSIVDWNPQSERTFGWTREEVLGRDLAETIVPPAQRQAHREGLKRFLQTGEGAVLNRRIELTAMHRDGREFPVELTISPLRFQNSWVFNAFVHDITQRKQAAEAMQLAKEAAEMASRAKSDFLANMSHEIRTPMNAIMGMTELVLDSPLTSEQREYLSTVKESSESLLSILNDVLDFSKIEAGKLSLERTTIDLRDCLGDTMKLLAPKAHRGSLELACHIASDVPNAIMGDPSRLRQIIVNLVGNALKFTERGEVVLDVGCRSHNDREAFLSFSVRDTGIGIAPDQLQRIFQAFEQADTSSTRRFAGTGLGLAISSTLVEMMGGRIWVESELGKGSTFHFTARFDLSHEAPQRPVPKEAARIHGTRVLVVDDNATNLRILDEVLRNWGMLPTLAANAQQAIELLREAWRSGASYPLVLTDVNMPGIDGFALVEQIKRDGELSSTIIMMLTSGDRPGDVGRCEQLGAASYLMKPIKQSELFDAVMVALGVTQSDEAGSKETARQIERLKVLNILLAEDSLPNQKLAVGLLTKYGHKVTVANNGVEAVDALDAGSFDVVLMDVQMPEMDGLEATRTIRRRESNTGRHVPIVAMTAHAMKGDREQCLEAGMDDYVSKPIRIDALFAALGRVAEEVSDQPEEDSMHKAPSQAPAAAAGEVDWSAALTTAQNDADLLKAVAEAFLEECPTLLEQLDAALSEADADVVRRAAHTIKGSMRTFAPNRATYQLAAKLERLGADKQLDGGPAVLDELKQKLEQVSGEVRQFISTGKVPGMEPVL